MEELKETLRKLIIEELKTIYDPEIPVNIYALGLIYEILIDDNYYVTIRMTLTSPNCPIAESLPIDVREKTKAIEGINDVKVEIVFDPPWDVEKISDEAKLDLGLL